MLKWRTIVAVLAALAVLGAGCSDGTETSSTVAVDSADDVVFGDGVIPETIPEGFPLPTGSAIGATMVVTSSGFTEVVVRVSASLGITAEFFDQQLGLNGFTVARSESADDGWVIEFSDESANGTVTISEPVQGISQALIRYNVP